MKKLGFLTAVAAAGLLFFSAPAQAAPLDLSGGQSDFYFTNVENWVDNDAVGTEGYGVVSVGDLFYGILNVQNVDQAGSTIWQQDNIAAGGIDTLSGFFYTQITAMDLSHVGGTGQAHITFGAADTADPWGIISQAEINAGVVTKYFKDDTSAGSLANTAFTKSSGSVAQDIANATDGSLWASLTLGGGDTYWYSHAPVNPTNVEDARSWFGLDFLVNNTGYSFLDADDPGEDHLGGERYVEMYGDSHINSNEAGSQAGVYWGYTSEDPATVVTPEPSTFILLGAGLLGAAVVRRKMKKKS